MHAAALRRTMQLGDMDNATEDLGDLAASFSTPEHAAPEITASADEIGEH